MPLQPFSNLLTSDVFIVSQILIVVIALVLMALSITAYRNTSLKKIIYAIIAFGLFASQHILNFIDGDVVDILPDDVRYALFSVITLSIMALFFLAIIKK